jgi:rare lipoprotein A
MLLLLSGCSSAPESRYEITQDTAPSFDYGELVYDDIIPTLERHNTWTSRPYYVFGKKYYPMTSAIGFEETGGASWYGLKFHGHKTANGEIFDMFALTAAHKTLPLPSFVKVTNVKNGKSAIVRVNDRGPFHGTRIIDLSYGAAKKLGYHKYGVADVKMELLDVNEAGEIRIGSSPQLYVFENGELLAKPSAQEALSEKTLLAQNLAPQPIPQSLFVQVMAMENGDKIREFASSLSNLLQVPNVVPKIANIYRLQLGPLESEQKAQNIIQELKKIGFEQAFTIQVMQ